LSERKKNTQGSEFALCSFNISLFRRFFFAFGLFITYKNTLSYPFGNLGPIPSIPYPRCSIFAFIEILSQLLFKLE
jgi:hypothetical protein